MPEMPSTDLKHEEMSALRLEDAPWFSLEEACQTAFKANLSIGQIKQIMIWCGPESCYIYCHALKVCEGGELPDRFRFYMLQSEAEAARVSRGLEYDGSITMMWNTGISLYRPWKT